MSTTTITTTTTHRPKIRFAPLPDPRRSVLLGDDGVEHPIEADDRIPASVSLAIVGAQPPSVPSPQIYNNIPLPPSPLIQPQPEASTSACIPSTSTASSSSGKHWSKSLLTPFLSAKKHHKKSSSPSPDSASGSSYASSSSSTPNSIHSLTPTQSPLCDISLSRPATNDGSGWGAALSRWTSGGSMSSSSNPGKGYGFGAPLARTQSTQSWKKSKGRRPSSSSLDARASGLLSSLHSDKPKPGKGTRLLNGRVYGAKRGAHANANTNPFSTISSTYPDPEFVEWGYGGTGSVKHQKDGVGGRVWGRLAKEGSVFDQGEGTERGRQPTSPSRSAAAEDDDGSGMGWVKRRREQREREAREKAEREAQEQAQADADQQIEKEQESEQEQVDLTASVSTMDTSTTDTTIASTQTGETTPPESPISPLVAVVEEDKLAPAPPTPTRQQSAEDHVTRAVNVPAPPRVHAHGRNKSLSSLREVMPLPVAEPEEEKEDSGDNEDEDEDEEESGEGEESGEEEDSGDNEEDEESDEEVRKTSLGAGVEVVSRHRA